MTKINLRSIYIPTTCISSKHGHNVCKVSKVMVLNCRRSCAHKVPILCTSSYLNNRTLPPFSYVLGVKCGVHLCCYTCCDYIQLISVELPLLGNYARNGRIYCNLIPRIPGILQYKPNPKINFCSFFIIIQFNKNN